MKILLIFFAFFHMVGTTASVEKECSFLMRKLLYPKEKTASIKRAIDLFDENPLAPFRKKAGPILSYRELNEETYRLSKLKTLTTPFTLSDIKNIDIGIIDNLRVDPDGQLRLGAKGKRILLNKKMAKKRATVTIQDGSIRFIDFYNPGGKYLETMHYIHLYDEAGLTISEGIRRVKIDDTAKVVFEKGRMLDPEGNLSLRYTSKRGFSYISISEPTYPDHQVEVSYKGNIPLKIFIIGKNDNVSKEVPLYYFLDSKGGSILSSLDMPKRDLIDAIIQEDPGAKLFINNNEIDLKVFKPLKEVKEVKEVKTLTSPQSPAGLSPSQVKEIDHTLFILSNIYHNLHLVEETSSDQYSKMVSTLFKYFASPKDFPQIEMLFGKKDAKNSSEINIPKINLEKFFNPVLREGNTIDIYQILAIEKAIQAETRMLSIHGGPGVAKTTVTNEIIKQLVLEKKMHVLVLSPGHVALDNILSDIVKDESIPVLRFASDKENVSEDIFPIYAKSTAMVENNYNLNESSLARFDKASQKNRGGGLYGATVVGSQTDNTLNFLKNGGGIPEKYDVIIIDEAGEVPILESTLAFAQLKKEGRIILLGDIKQLRPFGVEQEVQDKIFSELKDSVPGFSNNMFNYAKTSILEFLTNYGLGDSVRLKTNYRSHPKIVKLVSDLSYSGELVPGRLNDLSDIPPLKLIDLKDEGFVNNRHGEKEVFFSHKSGTSYKSYRSAKHVERILENLLKRGVKSKDIAIISPYGAQRDLIKERLRKIGFSDLPTINDMPKVATVDSFQGSESKVVILDLVLSNNDNYIGFLKDWRRLNVAISRPRDELYVILDSRTFTRNEEMAGNIEDDETKYGREFILQMISKIKELSEDD